MGISANQPIRLTSGDAFTKAIGRNLRVFLDGEEVDAERIYALDESAGWIDFLIPKGGTQKGWQVNVDPVTQEITPRLTRAVGRVEVRLKDTASAAVRGIYAGLRDGSLRAKLDILRGAMKK